MKKIVITTGDFDGVGLEVTCKALSELYKNKSDFKFQTANYVFIFWAHKNGQLDYYLPILKNKFNLVFCSDLDLALKQSEKQSNKNKSRPFLYIIVSDDSPAMWVEQAAKAALNNKIQGLVTGPLSKTEIQKAGLSDIGHTDILKRICKTKHAFMCFLGNKFNVVLVTGHIPVSDVESKLNYKLLSLSVISTIDQIKLLKLNQQKKIQILGFNPHSGDKGIIGDFEIKHLNRWVSKIKKRFQSKIKINGPLVPDAAFSENTQKETSFYVCLYHDQGLIPFKMAHGFDDGVHVTLGLPILRCSVDHGTAKDIFGKDIANHKSMLKAIQYAIKGAK